MGSLLKEDCRADNQRSQNFPPCAPCSSKCNVAPLRDRMQQRKGVTGAWTDDGIPGPNLALEKCLQDSHVV